MSQIKDTNIGGVLDILSGEESVKTSNEVEFSVSPSAVYIIPAIILASMIIILSVRAVTD